LYGSVAIAILTHQRSERSRAARPDDPIWDVPRVLITPLPAGDTLAADRRAFRLVGKQVRRYLHGEPLANVVKHGY
jgi:phosphoglycerate dehydrogenase-like enzyme